jgi:hypothetical protein
MSERWFSGCELFHADDSTLAQCQAAGLLPVYQEEIADDPNWSEDRGSELLDQLIAGYLREIRIPVSGRAESSTRKGDMETTATVIDGDLVFIPNTNVQSMPSDILKTLGLFNFHWAGGGGKLYQNVQGPDRSCGAMVVGPQLPSGKACNIHAIEWKLSSCGRYWIGKTKFYKGPYEDSGE